MESGSCPLLYQVWLKCFANCHRERARIPLRKSGGYCSTCDVDTGTGSSNDLGGLRLIAFLPHRTANSSTRISSLPWPLLTVWRPITCGVRHLAARAARISVTRTQQHLMNLVSSALSIGYCLNAFGRSIQNVDDGLCHGPAIGDSLKHIMVPFRLYCIRNTCVSN